MQLSGMQLSGLTCNLYVVSWSTIHFLRVYYSSYFIPANVCGLTGRAQQAPAVKRDGCSLD